MSKTTSPSWRDLSGEKNTSDRGSRTKVMLGSRAAATLKKLRSRRDELLDMVRRVDGELGVYLEAIRDLEAVPEDHDSATFEGENIVVFRPQIQSPQPT